MTFPLLARCRCLCAVPVVFQGPGKLSVVGSLSAALTVYHVTVAKLAIRQVGLKTIIENSMTTNLKNVFDMSDSCLSSL